MIGAIRGEWIKLVTVRSPVLCILSVAVVTGLLAFAIGNGQSAGAPPLTAQSAATGLLGYGIVILMVMAALQCTGEYRSGTMATSFQIHRGRASVIGAKAIVVCIVSAIAAGLLALLAIVIAKGAAGSHADHLSLLGSDAVRLYWGVPVFAVLATLLAIGVANLIRSTAGTVAVLIIWPLLIEGLTTLIPHVGATVASYMPFLNADYFLGNSQGRPFAWNEFGGLAVFAGYAITLYLLGLLSVAKRDI
jgi:ABC-2 type transport system permease protein